MGIVARQAGLNAISIVLGTITGAINTLLILPRAFEGFEEGWGLIKVLTAYAMIFSQFMHGGIPNAIVRYFPRLSQAARPRFLTLLFLIPLASSVLFLLILLLAGTTPLNLVNPDDAMMLEKRSVELFILTATLTFFFSLNGYLSAVLKTTVFQFLNETFLKTWYLGIAAAYLFNWLSFDQLLTAYVGGYVIATLVLLIHAVKSGFSTRWSKSPLGIPTRELVTFSVYSILDRGASILVQNLDIIMIGLLASLEDVAFYTLAFYIGSVAMIPQKSLLSIANPIASNAIAANDSNALRSIYQSSSLIQTLIGGIIFATIWVSIDEIMLLLPEKFSGGKWVVFYIGISKLIQMATGVSGGHPALLSTLQTEFPSEPQPHSAHHRYELPFHPSRSTQYGNYGGCIGERNCFPHQQLVQGVSHSQTLQNHPLYTATGLESCVGFFRFARMLLAPLSYAASHGVTYKKQPNRRCNACNWMADSPNSELKRTNEEILVTQVVFQLLQCTRERCPHASFRSSHAKYSC